MLYLSIIDIFIINYTSIKLFIYSNYIYQDSCLLFLDITIIDSCRTRSLRCSNKRSKILLNKDCVKDFYIIIIESRSLDQDSCCDKLAFIALESATIIVDSAALFALDSALIALNASALRAQHILTISLSVSIAI